MTVIRNGDTAILNDPKHESIWWHFNGYRVEVLWRNIGDGVWCGSYKVHIPGMPFDMNVVREMMISMYDDPDM